MSTILEERLRALISVTTQVVWTTDPEGMVVEDSPSWRALTGQSYAEFKGSGWLEAVHPEDREARARAWREAVATKARYETEYRVRRPDGSYARTVVRAAPVFDADGRIREWVGLNIDVTERRRTEERLRASEARYRLMVENITDYAIITLDRGGNIMSWNSGATRLLGYQEHEIVGRSGALIFTSEDIAKGVVEEEIRAALTEGRAVDERWHVKRDGSRFWGSGLMTPLHDEPGEWTGFVKVFRDLTETRQAQLKLRENEQHLSLIAHALPVYVLHCDAELRFKFVNNAYAERLGFKAEDVVGKRLWEIVGDEVYKVAKPHIDRVLSGQRVDYEEMLPYRSIGKRYMRSANVPELDRAGRVRGFIGVLIDITERKRAEDALQAADRRKDEFLAMLAHELRNPLAPIRTTLEIMRRGANDATFAWGREVIGRQVEQLTRMVDDLLDVSRLTQGKITLKMQPVAIHEVVERAVETSRPLIDSHKHRLSVALPPQPVYVNGDAVRLAQVVSNLLNNAAKYTQEGGAIALRVERLGKDVELRVKDNGSGISAELLPSVFELFIQADQSSARSQGGLGIGLPLVRSLVEKHGGTVHAASDGPGAGSEFKLILPVCDPPRQQARILERPASRPAVRCRILVIDDNVDAAESMETLLSLVGHDVRTALDGETALRVAREQEPQLVLCDIGLPGMDGYELIRRLRAQLDSGEGEMPVIAALTGYGQPEDRERTAAAGFDYHLVKPFDPAELLALVEAEAERVR